MHHMRGSMDVSHPLLADELEHVLLDRDLTPEDNDSSPEALMQLLWQSRCFESECTWARALARLV